MLRSIRSGAAGCWTLENLAPRVIARNFDPGFMVEHFIKDMGIALDEARRMNLALPGLALVHQLYVAVEAQGHGRKGTHALMLAIGKTQLGAAVVEAVVGRSFSCASGSGRRSSALHTIELAQYIEVRPAHVRCVHQFSPTLLPVC